MKYSEFTDNVAFVDFDKSFLKISYKWLNNAKIKKLTMTPDFTEKDQLVWYNSLKDNKSYKIWGVKYGKTPIGVCGLKKITDTEAEYWGYIGDDKYWGKGIGRLMMEHTFSYSRQIGLKRLYLNVWRENDRAIHLYKKLQFKEESRGDDTIKMTKTL